MALFFHKTLKAFSNDIGIDLGTANTLVYVRGKGIVLNEPSIVAINQKTGRVVAVGKEAKAMLGRTPEHIKTIRPLTEGVVSDFDIAEEMLSYFLNAAQKGTRAFWGPRVVVGVPSNITNVEARAVHDAAKNAGAREVFIVEEPMAGAIGLRLPVGEPAGTMVIDIGGGTTDIAVLALNGTVRSKNIRIAGDRLNRDIMEYIRATAKLIIGEKTAEEIKIAACSLFEKDPLLEIKVSGRDAATGLPREITVTNEDIRRAVFPSIETLAAGIREVLEQTPPDVLSDILARGAALFGGGALIRGLPEYFSAMLEIPIHSVDDPLTSVVRGTGILAERADELQEVFIDHEIIDAEHLS